MATNNRGDQPTLVDWALPLIGLLLVAALCFGIGAVYASTQGSRLSGVQLQQMDRAKGRFQKGANGMLSDPASNYTAFPDQNSAECYYAYNHDIADLCAQWRAALAAEKAADWARNSFWISLVAGVLSAFGVVLLIWSLRQTEKSLAQTRVANEIARNAMIAELRPIMVFEKLVFTEHSPESWLSAFQWKNIGRGPARLIKMDISRDSAPLNRVPPSGSSLIDTMMPASTDGLGAIVQEAESLSSCSIMVNKHHFLEDKDFSDCDSEVYLLGRVEYCLATDANEQLFKTEVVVQMLPCIEKNGSIYTFEGRLRQRVVKLTWRAIPNGIRMI